MNAGTRYGQMVCVREETRQVVYAMQLKQAHKWRSFGDAAVLHPDVGAIMRKAKVGFGTSEVPRHVHALRGMWATALCPPQRGPCVYCVLGPDAATGDSSNGIVCAWCQVASHPRCANRMVGALKSDPGCCCGPDPSLRLPGVFQDHVLCAVCQHWLAGVPRL